MNGENRFGVLILDPWRVWTVREFICQVGVILAIRKIRDGETKDRSNCHIMPVIFQQRFGLEIEAVVAICVTYDGSPLCGKLRRGLRR